MTRFSKFCLALATTCLVIASSAAAHAADPNGTWEWTFDRQGNEIEIKLDLKTAGEKLTGKIYANERETEISDGTFKNDEVSFKTVRERDGNKFVMAYKGKVTGDKISGTVEFQTPDQTRSRPWEATRAAKK